MDNEENEPEISNAAHGPMIQTQIPIKHCGLRDLSWSTEQCFDDTHGISEKSQRKVKPYWIQIIAILTMIVSVVLLLP
jgi:predicted nucleic acid-binding Zn ribbon protein